MKAQKLPLLLFILLFSCSLYAQNDNVSIVTAKAKAVDEYVPDEFIVQFKANVAEQVKQAYESDAPQIGVQEIDALNSKYGVKTYDKMFKSLKRGKSNMVLAEKYGLTRTYVIELPEGSSVMDAVSEFSKLSDVVYAEPNYMNYLNAVPTDPLYSLQWGMNNTGQAIPNGGGGPVGTVGADINIEPAWDLHTGSSSVIVAIIDSGVDYDHPEFDGRIVDGYDTFDDDDDPMDFTGHGTSCAGIVGANANNGQGVAGVNWHCKIMPIKIMADGATSFPTEPAAEGLIWAADEGAHILSNSWGGSDNATKQNAIDYASDAGCVILASRGNNNNSNPSYPASYSNVIAIGALSPCNDRKSNSTCDGETWWGSSFGSDLDVMAPGARIHTTDILGDGGYEDEGEYEDGDYTPDFNGTSAACPFAAGVAALLYSYKPGLTHDDIAEALQMSAVDLGDPGFDNQTGFGRLNAHLALKYLYNVPPVAMCQNVEVAANENCQGEVTADMINDGSYDDNGDDLTFELTPAGPYDLGETEVTLTVSDDFTSSSCDGIVTVVDLSVPVVNCPDDIMVYNDPGQCGAIVDFTVTATDNCDTDVVISLSESSGSFFLVGETVVTATATDDAGNESHCAFTINVEDNEPPVIVTNADPIYLWPPNHKYVSFDIDDLVVSVSDNCTSLDLGDIVISKGTSDEPEDALGIGDGKTFDDIIIAAGCQIVDVRRERGEDLNGRVYTIHFEVADEDDNVGTASAEIHIPIMPNGLAVDDGVAYTEFGCEKSSPIVQANDLSSSIGAYPNPFTDQTTIAFEVPTSGYTSISVYNSTGTLIENLFEGPAKAGHNYNLQFSSGNLPNGIYFYNMITHDGNSVTKKLILK